MLLPLFAGLARYVNRGSVLRLSRLPLVGSPLATQRPCSGAAANDSARPGHSTGSMPSNTMQEPTSAAAAFAADRRATTS